MRRPNSRSHHRTWKACTFFIRPVNQSDWQVRSNVILRENAENLKGRLYSKDAVIPSTYLQLAMYILESKVDLTRRLRVHVASHTDRLCVLDRTGPNGKDIANLIDFDYTSQALTFGHQPISCLSVFLAES